MQNANAFGAVQRSGASSSFTGDRDPISHVLSQPSIDSPQPSTHTRYCRVFAWLTEYRWFHLSVTVSVSGTAVTVTAQADGTHTGEPRANSPSSTDRSCRSRQQSS